MDDPPYLLMQEQITLIVLMVQAGLVMQAEVPAEVVVGAGVGLLEVAR